MKLSSDTKIQLTNQRPLGCFFGEAGATKVGRDSAEGFAEETWSEALDCGKPTILHHRYDGGVIWGSQGQLEVGRRLTLQTRKNIEHSLHPSTFIITFIECPAHLSFLLIQPS